MNEATIIIKAKMHKNFFKFKNRFTELGFTSIETEKNKLLLERIETENLKGDIYHFYRVVFLPDKIIFTYSLGQNKKQRELDVLLTLLNLIKITEDFCEVKINELHTSLSTVLNETRMVMESESYSTWQQVAELQEKYTVLEKKYKDLVLSSEQNARILLECEKKRDEYYARIKQLESISDEMLTQEIFKWLKTHAGEMNIRLFAKSFGIPFARVEERLEHLLKNGFIKKK